MARMSIDDRFLRDPRVTRLARALGWSIYEARGRLLEVYAVVYDMVQADRDPVLTVENVDTAADFPGLTGRLLEVDLAVKARGGVHIRGSYEYTGYLSTRKTSGRAGGIKSGESRRNKAKQNAKVTFAETEGHANPPDPVPDQAPDPDPDSDQDKDQEKNSAPPSARGSRSGSRKPKPSEPTAEERESALVVLGKLGDRNGVKYSGADAHVKLIAARLREGVTEADMRKVIGYCAVEKRWQGNEDMEQYLQPETLFGPKTIHRYLDPARSWFEKQGWELEDRQATPTKLEVVK